MWTEHPCARASVIAPATFSCTGTTACDWMLAVWDLRAVTRLYVFAFVTEPIESVAVERPYTLVCARLRAGELACEGEDERLVIRLD